MMDKDRIVESSGGGTGISSGFLRTKISLKGNQSQLSLVSPFYGMKPELPPQSQLLGSEDLIALFDLSASYNRFCGIKKPKDDLASFLPRVCGAAQISRKADASCSLRQLIEKPPIMGREISSLSTSQMVGFKLAPGPVSDSNRYFDLTDFPEELAISIAGLSGQDKRDRQKDDNIEGRHGKRVKRCLDEIDDGERKTKKHKSEEKEKKKRKKDKKKKKDKERDKKNTDEEQKKMHSKKDIVAPFF